MRRLHLTRSCASSPDNSLRHVVPDVFQPPQLRSSSPSFPRHLHHHHSLAYVFFLSSQYIPIPLQPTFLHFLGCFSHLRCPSNSFIPDSVQLGYSTHPHFRHIQLLFHSRKYTCGLNFGQVLFLHRSLKICEFNQSKFRVFNSLDTPKCLIVFSFSKCILWCTIVSIE